ncbi:MAG: helix-turn-helix transcriptional regulator [Burkholderiales bacterium]|nr:helix-turn-helix transcriptional regulator [Burkholderiales bacterium]
MNTISQIQYSDAWREDYPKSTGHAATRFVLTPVKTAMGAALLVFASKSPIASPIPQIELPAQAYCAPLAARRSAQENLQRIREVFSPSISALARSLGVQRQSIYNWQNGEAVNEINAAKLEDLAKAADLFAREASDHNHIVLERKFEGGKTLLQIVQDGGSAQAAISLLIPILQREEKQRKELNVMFANRTPGTESPDFDLPAPNDAF